MAGARATQSLAVAFGADWARGTLVPHLRDLFTAPGASYLQRITVVHAIADLILPRPPAGAPAAPAPELPGGRAPRPGAAPGSPLAVVAEDVLPVLLGALADPVPNVRFVGARALEAAADAAVFSAPRVAADILPPLAALAERDADADVRHFAAAALEVARRRA